MASLPGDVLVAAAFLSYAGPFDTAYRSRLVAEWLDAIRGSSVPFSEEFEFTRFLAKPTDVRDWNIKGLPADEFSTENGVIVTRCRRWPLMIDPEGQANNWIKNLEAANSLRVTDLKEKDFLKKLETAISFGEPYLLQDVEEELDPALEPVLSKAIVVRGSRKTIKLGDKELDYSEDFKLYITTKLANPHYTPEVSTKTTIANFSVKQDGLEEQLLGVVCGMEQEKLERKKNDLVMSVAVGRRTMVELEDKILDLLANAKGSLIDDSSLVETLEASKKTSEQVAEQIKVAVETEKSIDQTREGYRPVAHRASLLYFVLSDLSSVDPMYMFSLDAYMGLFRLSIIKSREEQKVARQSSLEALSAEAEGAEAELKARIEAINSCHLYGVYEYACRALFERHKLLLSLRMSVRILIDQNKLPRSEWMFFLKGGVVMDRSEQSPNPAADWLDPDLWDNITEAEKVIEPLQGLSASFDGALDEWRQWYMTSAPEEEPLPADWGSRLTDFQRLILIRSIRPDRVIRAVTAFVAKKLDKKFTEPPAFDLKRVFQTSSSRTPLVFVLSPGVDPTRELIAFAASEGAQIEYCSLGQG